MSKGGVVGGIIGALVIFGIIGNCIGGGSSDPSNTELENAANKAVATDLTDPADAKFAQDSDVQIEKNKDNGSFYLTSYVDAKNAFGGTIRNKFVATLSKTDSGDWNVNWILTNGVTGQLDTGSNVESGN